MSTSKFAMSGEAVNELEKEGNTTYGYAHKQLKGRPK